MQRRLIQRVQKDKRFSVGDPASRELLVNRKFLSTLRAVTITSRSIPLWQRSYQVRHERLRSHYAVRSCQDYCGCRPGAPCYILLDMRGAVATLVEATCELRLISIGCSSQDGVDFRMRDKDLPLARDGSIWLVHVDQWLPELIDSLDRHSPSWSRAEANCYCLWRTKWQSESSGEHPICEIV